MDGEIESDAAVVAQRNTPQRGIQRVQIETAAFGVQRGAERRGLIAARVPEMLFNDLAEQSEALIAFELLRQLARGDRAARFLDTMHGEVETRFVEAARDEVI